MNGATNGVADSSQSFLTAAQRESLDAALALKEKTTSSSAAKGGDASARGTRKHGAVHVKPAHGLAGDRKSKNPKGGDAKKKGGGGKFTWGAVFSESADGPQALDKNDPNYDSDEDAVLREAALASDEDGGGGGAGSGGDAAYQAGFYQSSSRIVQAVDDLKAEIMAILKEYLESGDMDEAAACIGELRLPQYDYYIVKRALSLALDRKDREREAVSLLLSSLYGQGISPQQMQKGFVALLEDFDELVLDVPEAVPLMALFVSRAIVDEILPPSFVARITPPAGSHLEKMKSLCAGHLRDGTHSAERLLRCWGSESKLGFLEARERIKAMLREYVASGDVAEVERQLTALNAPFMHHEVVKQALMLATDDMPRCAEPMERLLARLAACSEISSLQIYKGFQRFVDQLDDLALDTPHLREAFHTFYEACIARGVIDPADQDVLSAAESGGGGGAAESDAAAHVRNVAEFSRDAMRTIREYFESGDAKEVARILSASAEPGMLHIFVKLAVSAALERSFRQREAVSQLLVDTVPEPIPEAALVMAFTRLLASCEDLVLDVPDAPHMLSLFLARLVVDEVVPPAFLTRVLESLKADSLAVGVVRNTSRLLSSPHAAERILQCWHGGFKTISQLNGSIDMLIREFLANGDLAEAERSLHELASKPYHHEFVRRCFDAAFERPERRDAVARLLQHMCTSGEVTQTQLQKGIARTSARLEDSKLDCPHAADIYEEITQRARKDGWLEDESK